MNEASGSKWLPGDLEPCRWCAAGNEQVGKKTEWQDRIYNSSLFSLLDKGGTACLALQRNRSHTLNIVIQDVGEAQTLFPVERVIREYIKSVFLRIP